MKSLNNHKVINKIFPYLPTRIRNVLYYRFLWNIDFPEIVHIENTNACNARCIICAREKMTRPVGVMSFDLFKKIIDECAKYNIVKEVHLHGYGEPLLDNMLIEKIKYAKNRGIKKTYFVTNASLLNGNLTRALISAGLDRIKFSFYGATKQTYEKIHVGLKFEEVEGNIRYLFQIRKEMKSRTPSVNMQFVPQSENIEEKSNFFGKWQNFIDKKIGDCIEEFYLHNWIYGRKYNPNHKQINNLESCIIPFRIIQILWNGDVVPCVFDFNGQMLMGQIRTKDIREIWNNGQYKTLRQIHRQREYEKAPLCMRCDQLR